MSAKIPGMVQGYHILAYSLLVPYRKDVTAHSSGLLVYVSNGLITSRTAELENYLEESLWVSQSY